MPVSTPRSSPRETPLLIYDGDCAFCKFWVEYWKSLTGDLVSYAPFQEVADQVPEISLAEFQAAAQFVDRQGNVSSGAEAVFRSLACVPEKRWLLWCYLRVPGVASVSDSVYGFVARHRGGLYGLTRLFWGKRLEQPRFTLTRSVFLKLLGVIYLIAFASWFPQVRGLIGSQGILPAGSFLSDVYRQVGARGYFLLPTLAWLHPTDGFLQMLTGAGIALSLPVVLGMATGPSLLMLWLLYLSQVSIGRDFMAFQWDILLLEAGFLAIFFAPWKLWNPRAAPRPSITFVWLFRWLVFRVFFLSGLVKLESRDPAWRNLTAMSFHYETQPLPNIVAWYIYQLPIWFHKLSTVFVFGLELGIPFLIFAPRRLRIGAAYGLIFLQVLILLTGNYCFFNLLTIVLCLLLFDDEFLLSVLPQAIRKRIAPRTEERPTPLWHRFATGVLALVLLTGSLAQIAERVGMDVPKETGWLVRPLEPFYITNTYGLFAVMTTTRPEIMIEGSNDGERWLPYEFRYKPGDLSKAPRWVAPHQPRLDWQMWFAALSNYQNNPWIVHLAARMLEGSPEVLHLLATNPFPDHPPRYIRALVYDYRFTSWEERRASGNWWAREPLGVYLSPVSLNSF